VKGILELCWGLSLNLSSEKAQRELGESFKEQLFKALANRERSPDEVTFFDNLLMALSAAIRNIGFVRENHVRYIDFKAHQLAQEEQNLNQTADFFSFSGSGLYTKIASFLGIGSALDLANAWRSYQSLGFQATDIAIFLVAGLFGVIVVTGIVRLYRYVKGKRGQLQAEKDLNAYWLNNYKPDMSAVLYTLVMDIRKLAAIYSSDSWSPISKDDDLLTGTAKQVKRLINDEILPPDSLAWLPWLPHLEEATIAATTAQK
jgi:hypothetical protein